MLVVSLAASALAAPVDRGLQAQIHPLGYDFVSEELSGTSWSFGPTVFETYWECYDPLVINDLNLSVQIDDVALVPQWDAIGVEVDFGEVRGENITLAGYSGWIDICIDFTLALEYIELNNGSLTGELSADVVGSALELSFPSPVVLEGDLSSEVSWLPDDIIWLFLQNTALDLASGMIEEELPPLVSQFTAEGFLFTTFGDFDVRLGADEVRASPEGLWAAIDVDIGGDGGEGVELDLEPRGQSHVAVGLTEALAEEILDAAFAEGVLDQDSPIIRDLIVDLLATLDWDDDVEVALGVQRPASVTIGADGVHLDLKKVTLTADSPDGERLLEMVADIGGWLELQVENGGLVLTAHELELEIEELDLSRLLDRDPDNLQSFLEGWVTEVATVSLRDLEMYHSHFEALGYVLRVDEGQFQDGGLGAWFTLFAADDPEVDRIAPDTEADVEVDGNTVHATFTATDDRPGQLMYSYRVDDKSWSRWSFETEATIEVEGGAHTLEVRSRDAWHNRDESPDEVKFSIASAEVSNLTGQGCGCATGPRGSGWVLAVLALLGLARRRS